jgi:hypothetical protein
MGLDYETVDKLGFDKYCSVLDTIYESECSFNAKRKHLKYLAFRYIKKLAEADDSGLSNDDLITCLWKTIETLGTLKRLCLDQRKNDLEEIAEEELDKLEEEVDTALDGLKETINAKPRDTKDRLYYI